MKKSKIFGILLIIAGVVLVTIEYTKKVKIEKHSRIVEDQIAMEKSMSTTDLKKYISITKDEVNTNTTTQNFAARWEADNHGYYYVPGNSLTRIDGSTINFYVTNYLQHITIDVKIKVEGTTYKKNQNDDFIWPATNFYEYVNVNLKSSKSKKVSQFFDTYVYPEAQNPLAGIGGLFASVFGKSDSKVKESQPINPSTVKFTIISVNKTFTPNYPQKYSGWLSIFD